MKEGIKIIEKIEYGNIDWDNTDYTKSCPKCKMDHLHKIIYLCMFGFMCYECYMFYEAEEKDK